MQRSLTAVRLERTSGAGAGELTLVEGDTSFTVALGDTWVPTEAVVSPTGHRIPVAAAGAFNARGELRAEIRFLDTPHTLVLILDPTLRTFRALWPTIPMHGPELHRLLAPR